MFERGFSLIELLITLMVLSFGLLGLAGFQTHIIHANAFSRDMTIAATIGSDLLEESKAAGLGSLAALESSTQAPYRVDIDGDGLLDDPYQGRFTWARTLTPDPTGEGKFYTVSVTVFWSDARKEHKLNYRTVVG
ncbi:MAG: prepilin-type N-terminal cleavage/methylation domain-containing protein [bacterium]